SAYYGTAATASGSHHRPASSNWPSACCPRSDSGSGWCPAEGRRTDDGGCQSPGGDDGEVGGFEAGTRGCWVEDGQERVIEPLHREDLRDVAGAGWDEFLGDEDPGDEVQREGDRVRDRDGRVLGRDGGGHGEGEGREGEGA